MNDVAQEIKYGYIWYKTIMCAYGRHGDSYQQAETAQDNVTWSLTVT